MLISNLSINLNFYRKLVSKTCFQNMPSKIKAALIQCKVGENRDENLKNVSNLIETATKNGAELVTLPEWFNSPYGTEFFNQYAEVIPDGPSSKMLSEIARKHKIYIVGGSMPEKNNGKIYNTCTVWNPNGDMIAKYSKIHLFDIDIPGGITFKESDILSPGNELATFDCKGVKIGIGICYDMRFEELAKLYRLAGCKLLIYPAAFNMTTGPLHWEMIQRSRANDNQLYVMAVSPARGDSGYIAWGHSQVTDPWGKVLVSAGHEQEIVYTDIDPTECDKVRAQIPIGHQRRLDIYNTVNNSKSRI